MENSTLEKFCSEYFDDIVKPKHLSEFSQKTPQGNVISGYLSRKPNRFLGSIIITHIVKNDGSETDVEQFVQGFPKINYWDSRNQLKSEGNILYFCNEKLDGTCLAIFPLKDENGNVIELVPKTRGKAVADDHILEMYSLVDKKAILDYFEGYSKDTTDVLFFELYGTLNRHEIAHMDTYIDIKLIGVYVDGKFLNSNEILSLQSEITGLRVMPLFTIVKGENESEFKIKWTLSESRFEAYKFEINDTFPTIYDAVQEIKSMLQKINDEYYKYNNRSLIEGVVINGVHLNGTQMYLKIKPDNIVKAFGDKKGINRRFILKEVRKYFDEYGSEVRELYEEDENHYMEYVMRNLEEEFPKELVQMPKTRKRIKKVFMDVWDSKIPPVSLQNIAEKLVDEHPDEEIPKLMAIFASEYPSKKKDSRHMYNILTNIKKRM